MVKPDGAKQPTRRDLVKDAVAALRAGTGPRPDLADAVASFLAQVVGAERKTATVPLYISKATWARANAKADSEERTRTDVIEEGYREVLAGRFVPSRPARSGWGSGAGGTKASPGVRLRDPDLAAQVTAYVAEHAEAWGWEPSPSQVAVAWLEQYAPAEPSAE